MKVARSFLFLIVLVLALYFIANSITSHTGMIVENIGSHFENCLEEKDIVLYVEDYDVMELKEMQTSEFLGNVEISGCVLNRVACIREGVSEYPTWVIEGKKVVGDIDVFKLADLAGCEMV